MNAGKRESFAIAVGLHKPSMPCPIQAERRMALRVGYRLAAGWTWALIAQARERYSTPPRMFPLISACGVAAWGVPIHRPSHRVEILQRREAAAHLRSRGDLAGALYELGRARALRLVGRDSGPEALDVTAVYDRLGLRIWQRELT